MLVMAVVVEVVVLAETMADYQTPMVSAGLV